MRHFVRVAVYFAVILIVRDTALNAQGYDLDDGAEEVNDPVVPIDSWIDIDAEWPYHHKTDNESLSTRDVCKTATTCDNCTTLSKWYGGCHWCSHDNACHPIGSVYGCAFGDSCTVDPEPTPPDDNHKQDKNSTSSGDACNTATTCENCTALSKWYGGCHWCSYDKACHAIGSVHGCAFGSSCNVDPTPVPPDNKNETDDDKTCFGKKTCRDCALFSHLCHWCAHDNLCHVIGSVSGCVTGVDCYDNSRCQRKESEPLPRRKFSLDQLPHGIGVFPLFGLFALSGLVICCATMCCCITTGVKGAYDELADLAATSQMSDIDLASPLLPPSTASSAPTPVPDVVAPTTSDETNSGTAQPLIAAEEGETAGEPTESAPLLSDQVVAQGADAVAVATSRARTAARRRAPRSMQRLYNACVFCYAITIAVVLAISLAAVRYYPQAPVYSICNDNVAWKSVIDSLTNMKVTADFQILASISNPNYMDAALDVGRGSFSHNGAFVGTFDIPPTVIAANSITDFLILAHLMPDKWDALSLTAEYYRGKLILSVDTTVTVRIPQLMNYTFQVETKGLLINVNEKSDRDLCACPTWNDPKPNVLEPAFMQLSYE